jgi:hypothetical protein
VSTLTTVRTRTDALWEWKTIIGAGIFATGLSQPEVLSLPFRRLLSDDLRVDVQQMALFFALASLPWSLKILSGLLLDSVPLFGTRRRHYLLLSVTGASVLWLLLGLLEQSFLVLLLDCIAINVLLVLASSAGGALYVEGGRRLGAIGQLAAVRVMVDNTNTLVAGPLSGWLAYFPFGTFTLVGAAIPLTLIPPVLALLREPSTSKYEVSAFRDAWHSVRVVVASRQAWAVGIFLCLVSAPQSFQSLLYAHQTKSLNLDSLTIGFLDSISGIGGIAAAAFYGLLRRRQKLRGWLVLGIVCGSLDAFIYSFYRSLEAAYAISLAHGFLINLSVLAMLEVAGLATPMGATALGFAFIASAWNTGIPIGDYAAATLGKHGFDFYQVVSLYAVVAPLTLFALFLLPKQIQEID